MHSGSSLGGQGSYHCAFEIPTIELRSGGNAGSRAQRKDARDEGQFAHADTIYEILAAAIEAIVNGQDVFSVAWHFIKDGRIGFEPVIIVVSDLFAAGIVEHQDRLNPAGYCVGDERNKLAG